MLDKKTATVVVALMLFGAAVALGAANVVVNGSGIVTGTKPAIEAELIIGHNGSPANILVITQANQYCFRGTVNDITGYDPTQVQFSGTLAAGGVFDAIASTTNDPNIWKLQITGDTGSGGCSFTAPVSLTFNGHLQIIPP
jgi:hypothetical protein